MVKTIESLTTISEWGSFLTRYLVVYGTLRRPSLKKTEKKDSFLLTNTNPIGTFKLQGWKIFYNKTRSFPFATYTGDMEDYMVVEIVDLLPNLKGNKSIGDKDLLVLYESHYLLDKYEGLHFLYRPVFLKLKDTQDNVYECKIYETLVPVDGLEVVPGGDFITPTARNIYKSHPVLCTHQEL